MDGEDTSRTVSRVNLPKIPSVYLSLMSFTSRPYPFPSSDVGAKRPALGRSDGEGKG